VVILIAIPLIIAAFTEKDYAVKREVTINRSTPEVFEYVRMLRNQENYNTWTMQDPKIKREYRGNDGTVGSGVYWESEEVGTGEQEIVAIEDNKRVGFKLHFIKPFEGLADAEMQTEELSREATKLSWGFKSSMAYPMNFMLLFMDMDKMLGTELEKGLANLKTQIEK
jgi:hypothetical protein